MLGRMLGLSGMKRYTCHAYYFMTMGICYSEAKQTPAGLFGPLVHVKDRELPKNYVQPTVKGF